MDEYDDVDTPFVILPGVDLTLWLRVVIGVMLVLAAGIAVAVVR